MKNINIFKISILSLGLILSSCSEDEKLNYLPVIGDVVTGEIESENKLEFTTNQIYDNIGGGNFYGAGLNVFNEVVSDNVFVSNSNSGYYLVQQQMNWFEDSNFGFWNSAYSTIVHANIVINEASLPETTRVKSLKGEAKLLRGLAYFTLLQYYSSNDPQFDAYGVPLNIEAYNPNLALPRSSVTEVYNQVIKDLTEGINEIDPSLRGDNKTFFNPIVGKFILSKVYLSRGQAGDYDKAIALSDEVLSTRTPIEGDKLYTYFTSTDPAITEQQNETLYEVEQTVQDNLGVNTHLGSFYSNQGAQRSLLVRSWVYNLVENSDIRKTLFNPAGTPDADMPDKGVWTRKWPRNTLDGNYTGNIKVFRVTEAKYIKMEALAKKGDNATALTLLNEHAVERGATPYTGDALTAILLDKQKEFIAEGHRFLDLKRNNLGFDRVTNCFNCSLEPGNKLWVLPIPLGERTRNPNITQHPLWQ